MELPAQDSTLRQLIDVHVSGPVQPSTPLRTFHGLRIVNAHTVEAPAKSELVFMILHRFGRINEGAYQFFGLDNASIRLGLDYGISDRLSLGMGRSSFEKTFDGYAKLLLLRQHSGKGPPVSIALIGVVTHQTLKYPDKPYLNATLRTGYAVQLPLARRFGDALSLQITPYWLHLNLVPKAADQNDLLSVMVGGRLRFSKRASLTAEYHLLPPGQLASFRRYNSLAIGLDLETGGHVFQLVFSNAQGMVETQYITRTAGTWGKGDIYFGFNISRNFTLGKRKNGAGWN